MRSLKISDAEVCNEVHAYFNERNIDNAVSKYSIDFISHNRYKVVLRNILRFGFQN